MQASCAQQHAIPACKVGRVTSAWACAPASARIQPSAVVFRHLRRQQHCGSRQACRHAVRVQAAAAQGLPEALLFDCDGVLVDTEAYGHRIAFNEAFKQKGIDAEWELEEYGRLLEIGGGKERMTHYFNENKDKEPFKSTTDKDAQQALVKELHLLKTDLFMKLIEDGGLPLRAGVARLVEEAIGAGVTVAVCSTSNEKAVQKIVDVLLGEGVSKNMRVFAGDVVPKKKPDPAIYLLAAKELSVDPAKCVVIEDSQIGLQAAKAAGMRCIVTRSAYTQHEDFSKADAVFDCIGEAQEARFSLKDVLTVTSAMSTASA